MLVQCTRCKFQVNTKDNTLPEHCTYCNSNNSFEKIKTSQELLDEVSDDSSFVG